MLKKIFKRNVIPSESSKERLFSDNFLRMFIANAILCSGFYMLMPILPLYAVHNLGIDPSEVGVILGMFSVSSLISRPIVGYLLDKNDRMKIYIPATLIFGLCFCGYELAASFSLLLIVRFLHGMSWGFTNTSTATIVADIIPASLRGAGIGYFGLSMNVAMAMGPSLAVFLSDFVPVKIIFLICSGLVFLALSFSAFVKPPFIEKSHKKFSIKTLYEKRVMGIAFLQFAFGFMYAGLMGYTILHGKELGIEGLGYFFLIFSLFIAVFRPFAGSLMEKQGPLYLLTSGYILLIIGNLMLAFADSTWFFLASAIPLGLGSGLAMPIVVTMTINVVKPSQRGGANATMYSAFDVGIGSGSVLLGVILRNFNYADMYIFSAVFMLIPILWFVFFVYKKYLKMYEEVKNLKY